MILRLGSLLLIFYGIGFALFGVTIGEPEANDVLLAVAEAFEPKT